MKKRGQLESIKAIIGIVIGVAIVIILFFVGGLVVKMIWPSEDTDLGALAYKVNSLKDGGKDSILFYVSPKDILVGFDYSAESIEFGPDAKYDRPGEDKHCFPEQVCICNIEIFGKAQQTVKGKWWEVKNCFSVANAELIGFVYYSNVLAERDKNWLYLQGQEKKIDIEIVRKKVEGGRDILEIKPLLK